MKIALICPSSMMYMPYVRNYEMILKEINASYDIINWDRFNIENGNENLKYRDTKIGHQRNFLDYYRYKKFLIYLLNKFHYEKIIVFGIQLTFFLKGILQKKYKGNYIIDIRDYHKIINYFNIKQVISNSSFVVLSSPGFKNWLPSNNRYVISHNTIINSLDKLEGATSDFANNTKINISYIGSIRDYKINIKFIDSLKNNEKINLYFHGDGIITKDIVGHLNSRNIKNVFLTGRYKRDNEDNLFRKSDLINVLIPNKDINSKTLLPNRLYNAVIYGKPVVAFKGTHLAEQVKKYNLGLVLDSFDDVEREIYSYIKEFNLNKYEQGRRKFLELAVKQNNEYYLHLHKFIIR